MVSSPALLFPFPLGGSFVGEWRLGDLLASSILGTSHLSQQIQQEPRGLCMVFISDDSEVGQGLVEHAL